MPELNVISFSLGLEVFFGVRNAGGEARRVRTGGAERAERTTTWPSPVDAREADLSPTAQRMQQEARERANKRRTEKEREADAESLYLLEVATAANSLLAKIKDKESLEVLLRWTTRLAKYGKILKTLQTPIRTSFWPPARHVEGVNGTPLSFEPPFSTPEEVREIYEEDAGNEFEDFLTKNRALSKKVQLTPKRNSFTALLESAKSSSTQPPNSATEQSQHMKSQVQSVLDLIDQVEKQDLENEMALRDLAEAIQSPIPSPMSNIKHLPRDSEGLDANNGMDDSAAYLADLSDDGGTRSDSSKNNGETEWDAEADGDAAKAPTTSESESSDASDDEWEVV